MTGWLGRIWHALNGDLLGRELTFHRTHPVLGEIVYYGEKGRGGHWETELRRPQQAKQFSVVLPAPAEGPPDAQVEFVEDVTKDLNALFLVCREALQKEFPKWSKADWPADWKNEFELDSLEAPRKGLKNGKWSICYYANSARRYFTAHLRDGVVSRVTVDG